MNRQTIASRANANHFGHPEATHGHDAPVKIPSAHSAKADAPPTNGNSKPGKPGKSAPQPAGGQGDKNTAGTAKSTIFKFNHASAKTVLLAGDFTGWDKEPVKMTRDQAGNWEATIALKPGRHQYRFLVDGEWQDDPHASNRVPNPFGTHDAVVEVA